jgi:hypothetical protein
MFVATTFMLAVTLGVSASSAGEIPSDKAVIEFTPKFGPVTFRHLQHSQLPDVDCVTCHHTLTEADTTIERCHTCHTAVVFQMATVKKAEPAAPSEDPEAAVPGAREAFHQLCRGCHERAAQADEPSGAHDSCRDCHG